jgi:hypothetical protein
MTTDNLLDELFETDAAGTPVTKFQMEVDPGPRKEIKTLHHALYALPKLEAIDARMDEMLTSLGTRGHDVNVIMDEVESLQAHGRKIMAQALYLDTTDRNSWTAIKQSYLHERGNNSVYGGHAKALRRFWHGQLDKAPVETVPSL